VGNDSNGARTQPLPISAGRSLPQHKPHDEGTSTSKDRRCDGKRAFAQVVKRSVSARALRLAGHRAFARSSNLQSELKSYDCSVRKILSAQTRPSAGLSADN